MPSFSTSTLLGIRERQIWPYGTWHLNLIALFSFVIQKDWCYINEKSSSFGKTENLIIFWTFRLAVSQWSTDAIHAHKIANLISENEWQTPSRSCDAKGRFITMGSLECRPIEKIPMGCVRLHLRSTNSIKEPYGIGKVQRGRLPPRAVQAHWRGLLCTLWCLTYHVDCP